MRISDWSSDVCSSDLAAPFSKGIWIDRAGARARTEAIVADYDVRTPGIEVPAHALSGGNQQKLIVGREMEAQPKVLVAAHPTRGVDVGAQAAIWDQPRAARAAGLAPLRVPAHLGGPAGPSHTPRVKRGES